MADQNFSMSNINENKNIDVRTQASDLGSIQEGTSPEPYNPSMESKNIQNQPPTSDTQVQNEINLNEFQVSPNQSEVSSLQSGEQQSLPPKNKNRILIPIIIFVAIVALGALGYFVIYPLLAPNSATESTSTTEISTTSEQTTEGDNLNLPLSSTTYENQTTTETSSSVNEAVNTLSSNSNSTTSNSVSSQAAVKHVSLFRETDYFVTSSMIVTGKNLTSISLPTTTKASLIEVTFTDPKITIASIFNELFGINLSQSGITQAFDPAATAQFIYVDEKGKRWLGIIGKVNTPSSLIDVKSSLSQIIESNLNLKNIFSSDPGSQGAWKNGDPIISPHRFTLFSKTGYSIDYGWKDNVFIMSSSYEGFKAAVSKLQ